MTASQRFSLTLSMIAMAPLVLGLLLIAIFTAPPEPGAEVAASHAAPAKEKAPA